MKKYTFYFLLIFLLVNFVSCSTSNQLSKSDLEIFNNSQSFDGKPYEDYTLHLGDIIDVKFFYAPELNETVQIRPDGKISLQLVDEVEAEGFTPKELDEILTKKYSNFLVKPAVSVIVKKFTGNKIYVGGEIKNPSVISIEGKITSLQAIFQAGGFNNTAEMGSVVVLRRVKGSNKPKFIVLNLEEDVEKPSPDSTEESPFYHKNDIFLKPYDIVFVPKTIIAKMDQFVDQYIDKLIPVQLNFGFSYLYPLKRQVVQ